MRYKHIFFDLDRTLWDVETNQRAALDAIYREHGIGRWYPDPGEFYWLFREKNEELWSLYSRGEIEGDFLRLFRFRWMLERIGVKDDGLAERMSRMYMATSPGQRALLPGAAGLLDYLDGKGYGMSLITNGFDEAQHRKIRSSGIAGYFSHVVTSETAGYKKPQREIFLYAAELAGVAPGESLMVGDDPVNDIDGAAASGMDTAYLYMTGSRPSQPPTYQIKELMELTKIL